MQCQKVGVATLEPHPYFEDRDMLIQSNCDII